MSCFTLSFVYKFSSRFSSLLCISESLNVFDGELSLQQDFIAQRENILPFPTPADGYTRVQLLGTTGAGKTTLVRRLIGTDPGSTKVRADDIGQIYRYAASLPDELTSDDSDALCMQVTALIQNAIWAGGGKLL
jgi:ABC-type cobalamin transport system, ATPase component